MKTQKTMVSFLVAVLLSCGSAQAGDMLFLDIYGMLADKSTLVIEAGIYQENFAIKLTFGGAVMARSTGIVYKEKVSPKSHGHIDVALNRLIEILNDPKTTVLRLEKELSKDLGLTFEKRVKYTEVR